MGRGVFSYLGNIAVMNTFNYFGLGKTEPKCIFRKFRHSCKLIEVELPAARNFITLDKRESSAKFWQVSPTVVTMVVVTINNFKGVG